MGNEGQGGGGQQNLALWVPAAGQAGATKPPGVSGDQGADFVNSGVRADLRRHGVGLDCRVLHLLPIQTDPVYSIRPSMLELSRMSAVGLSAVKGFTAEHFDHGSVKWLGPTDVRNLDIDKQVQILKSKVEIRVWHPRDSSPSSGDNAPPNPNALPRQRMTVSLKMRIPE